MPHRNNLATRLSRLIPIVSALLLFPPGAVAQEWLSVGGLFDGEASQTDDDSRLLSRNGGDPTASGRLTVWGAAEAHPRVHFVLLGEAEQVSGDERSEAEIQEAFVRYTGRGPHFLTVEAGKINPPIGSFAERRFSNRNPVIGHPDAYGVQYPLGASVEARIGMWDCRLAVMDEPLYNEDYVPKPGSAWRPVVGAGITPLIGLRLGASYTRGPYLNPDLAPFLTPGSNWRDYEQEIQAFGIDFSRGHFELNGELLLSSYEVPGFQDPLNGEAAYLDFKQTLTPRLYGAIRLEKNDYPFILPLAPGMWLARNANFYDAELGVGYRITPDVLLKVSYRRDLWTTEARGPVTFPDGYAFAAQISYQFDVRSWFQRPL